MSSDRAVSASGEPLIRVRGVGKCYHIYDKPRDRLKQSVLGRFKTYHRDFWALRDATFELRRGQSLGIMGRNGSGKSTLLQIIAGTLTPTLGTVEIRGRIAALLELGSGFHPEFTGRENIYLAGAILGITRPEMNRRIDEIIDFADIGQFIDQSVKTYSSGMHARLAFSVAVCVDPEILIVDEVLSVGDLGFRQKCVARINQLLCAGVTLLFVNHSPDIVKSLCHNGLVLVQGQPVFFGPAQEAADLYFNQIRHQSNEEAVKEQTGLAEPVAFGKTIPASLRYGSGHAQIRSVRLLDEAGTPRESFGFEQPIVIEVKIGAEVDLDRLTVSFVIRDATGVDLVGSSTGQEQVPLPRLSAGSGLTVRFRLANRLRPGAYGLCVGIERLPARGGQHRVLLDHADGCAAFRSLLKPGRPIRCKVHLPVEVEVQAPSPSPVAQGG